LEHFEMQTERFNLRGRKKRGVLRCEKVKVEEGDVCHELLGLSRLRLPGL